jgi:rhodanese-related sulfurtransferase
MKRYFISFALTLLFVSSIIACKQQEQTKEANRMEITVTELQQKIQSDSNLVILDVRTPEELTGPLGHIEGVINIPIQVLEKNLSKLEKYNNQEIYIICRSGNRSGVATKMLAGKGFKVKNVLGGMKNYNRIKK